MMTGSFDESSGWALAPSVQMRPEEFGALAYDFRTRRLSFLKHPVLVTVVEALSTEPSAVAACAKAGLEDGQRSAVLRALADLAEKGMIVEREG